MRAYGKGHKAYLIENTIIPNLLDINNPYINQLYAIISVNRCIFVSEIFNTAIFKIPNNNSECHTQTHKFGWLFCTGFKYWC